MRYLVLLLALLLNTAQSAQAKTINIVAAENFYGSVAAEIGGNHVHVDSIINNPNQDPHLFSISPKIAKAIVNADIIVYNGINYDSWAERLISSSSSKSAHIIIVADLLNKKAGANPHLWYAPVTMPVYAKALTTTLTLLDKSNQIYYETQLAKFLQDYQALSEQIKTMQLRNHPQIKTITATEPVFNYMADALGLIVLNQDFQLKVMNDIEPSAKEISKFEADLRNHQVDALLYNKQVNNPLTQRLQTIAKKANIPVIGISETLPPKENYIHWMLSQLKLLEQALYARD